MRKFLGTLYIEKVRRLFGTYLDIIVFKVLKPMFLPEANPLPSQLPSNLQSHQEVLPPKVTFVTFVTRQFYYFLGFMRLF